MKIRKTLVKRGREKEFHEVNKTVLRDRLWKRRSGCDYKALFSEFDDILSRKGLIFHYLIKTPRQICIIYRPQFIVAVYI